MSRKKVKEPKEENITLGPTVREGEHLFGVAHFFASFNDTFILRATRGNKTKTSSPGAQSTLKALAHFGMKIGRIEDMTPIPTNIINRKGGRRGKRL